MANQQDTIYHKQHSLSSYITKSPKNGPITSPTSPEDPPHHEIPTQDPKPLHYMGGLQPVPKPIPNPHKSAQSLNKTNKLTLLILLRAI